MKAAWRWKRGLLRGALVGVLGSVFLFGFVESGAAHEPFGDAIISNGVVQLGVHQQGHLNVPGGTPSSGTGTSNVGLRFVPTNAESTAPGCLCEGWGAADASTGLTGFMNQAAGSDNVDTVSFSSTAATAVSVVTIDSEGQAMRVTHDYHPAAATPNLYEVTVTVENVGSAAIGDLRYRRVMDWDVEPTAFSEFSTINGRPFPNLLFTSNNGFETADPLGERSNIGATGFFTDVGPADHGALFDFGFGGLDPGEKTTFTIFYGAAANETDAVAAIGAVGAEVWSFGQPSSSDPKEGTPNTFIFAFGSVGGDPFAGSDPRPPLTLDVFGPSEVKQGDPNPFTVRSVLTNVGEGDATEVTTRIVLGPGLTLEDETAEREVGTIPPNESREEVFHVSAPSDVCDDRTYSYDVFADYAERPEGEAERHVSKMVVVRGTGCPSPPAPPPPAQEPPPPPPPPVPADLTITMTQEQLPPAGTSSSVLAVTAGTRMRYLVTVTNNGPGVARNVALALGLPSGATTESVSTDTGSCSGTSTVNCSYGNLAVGQQAHTTAIATVTQAGPATATASVSASEPDPSSANNSTSATVDVTAAGFGPASQPTPIFGQSAGGEVVSGFVCVQLPNTTECVDLATLEAIPVGSTIDATNGRARIRVAAADGTIQTVDVYEGKAVLIQTTVAARSTAALGGAASVTEFRLTGGDFSSCTAKPAAVKKKAKSKAKKKRKPAGVEQEQAKPRKPVRRLWGNGSGDFRTRGRYASATVRGTVWLTEDYCNGTLIRVRQGTLTVRDLVKNTAVTVTAGKSYFAETPAPKAAKAKAKKKTTKKRKPAGGR
jgi:uncharacterized repeat protein (TIGR01451 family)